MTLTPPEFWTRSSDFRRQHRIDEYATATLVQRDLRSGTWMISGIPTSSPAAADLEAGGGIIAYYGEGTHRVVLDSGRVDQSERLEVIDETGDNEVINATGSLDLAYVEDRLAHPHPSDLSFTVAATKAYVGAAETVMKAVVNDNLGATAAPSRVQPHFVTVADAARGSAINDAVRMDPIGDLLAAWGVTGGIIPRCTVVDGQLTFDVYVPQNLTRDVVFSVARGTATRVRRLHSAPSANFVWAAGQDVGTAREFVFGGDAASQLEWGYRREYLADRRDTADLTVLAQTRDEELATRAPQLVIEVDALDTPGQTFGVHYVLGDSVTVVDSAGTAYARQVREVRIDCTPESVVRFAPLIGDPLTPPPDALPHVAAIRDLRSRIVNQESR